MSPPVRCAAVVVGAGPAGLAAVGNLWNDSLPGKSPGSTRISRLAGLTGNIGRCPGAFVVINRGRCQGSLQLTMTAAATPRSRYSRHTQQQSSPFARWLIPLPRPIRLRRWPNSTRRRPVTCTMRQICYGLSRMESSRWTRSILVGGRL